MSRRPHKKSRNGCLDCKRRHIRCDGNRPVCVNCSTAEIRCSYLGKDQAYIVPGLPDGISSGAPSSSASPAATPFPQAPGTEERQPSERQRDEYDVNITHMDLFNNLYSDGMASLHQIGPPDILPLMPHIRHALSTPYLMHQVLAMSALHLSIATPEKRGYYREHSTGLQSRALSLFNEVNQPLQVNRDNCAQMFLFSSLVGVHLLCDTMRYQRDTLEEFVDSFTHCLDVYRGVLTVIRQCRDLLLETELGQNLEITRILLQTDVRGSECDRLVTMVERANTDGPSREAYSEAIFHLQRVFDAHRESPSRAPMVFTWPALVPVRYVELLRQRKAEGLVILAHYAVLLHRARNLWLIGDGGRFLVESVSGSLGPAWKTWLEFPNASLREDVPS